MDWHFNAFLQVRLQKHASACFWPSASLRSRKMLFAFCRARRVLGPLILSAIIKGPQGAFYNGGQGEIRTHGGVSPTLVFKTRAINHSATCPYSIYLKSFSSFVNRVCACRGRSPRRRVRRRSGAGRKNE